MNYNFSTYDNRVKWQIDCDNTIKDKNNVILSSPTGSGKTKRYEFWALNKSERPIFITSPIKALSNQRFRELQDNGYKVGLETGDIKYIPHDDCDIICCTQEIYNNKYRNYKNSTLIIDEFSYIFEDEDRARVYIDSLYYSKAKNIMLCSATFGNSEVIRDYINKVANRDFFLYENNERLTPIEYKGEIKKENIRDSLVVAYSRKKCEIIAHLIYRDRISRFEQIMNKNSYGNFDPRNRNKKAILELAEKYNIDNKTLIELCTIGVTYYYGSLYPKEKMFVEELFERRLIDTVVGTDALALGVNFPIKNVVFTQLRKNKQSNLETISKNLFEQLSGRAGRKGFFDNGYIYYCDEFFDKNYKDYQKNNSNKKSLKKSFFKLVNAQNEEVQISLTANIKDILTGTKTIEEEARFIVEYSTNYKTFEEEKNKISKIVDYITTFDVATNYLKRYFNIDFAKGYSTELEKFDTEEQNKIEKLSNNLMLLQPYFDKDIGEVYLSEYTPEKNCNIFVDILMEKDLKTLINEYGKNLYDMLLLRKYIYKLPEKYSKNYDISLLDKEIDTMDYTILHPNEFKIERRLNFVKKENIPTKKNRKVYNCPNYFDRILIDGKEYVKILTEGSNMLVCDFSNEDSLNLHYIPINIAYKLIGFLKLDQRLDILNRVDLSTLIENEEIVDKIEGMKLSLRKKRR